MNTTEYKPRGDLKKLAGYIGMDPTGKGFRERIMVGAKAYGDRAMELAKKDCDIAESVWKTENWEATQSTRTVQSQIAKLKRR